MPLPKSADVAGKLILKYYAPATINFGMHFQKYNPQLFTPMINKEVRELKIKSEGFYLVYLPAFSVEKIITVFSQFEKERFIVFSNVKQEARKRNIRVFPLDRKNFLQQLANCSGVITAAGFSTTADALYLKKKLLVIPQKNQFEQKCNAWALKKMGVTVIKNLKKKFIPEMQHWMDSSAIVKVDYPDNSELIVDTIIKAGMSIARPNTHILPSMDFTLQLAKK